MAKTLITPKKNSNRRKGAGNIKLKMKKKRTICIQPGSSCSSLLITFPISSVQLYPTIIPIHSQNSQPYDWKRLKHWQRKRDREREGGRKRCLQWVGLVTEIPLSLSLSRFHSHLSHYPQLNAWSTEKKKKEAFALLKLQRMCFWACMSKKDLMWVRPRPCLCMWEIEQTVVLFSQWVMDKVGCVTEASVISNLATWQSYWENTHTHSLYFPLTSTAPTEQVKPDPHTNTQQPSYTDILHY